MSHRPSSKTLRYADERTVNTHTQGDTHRQADTHREDTQRGHTDIHTGRTHREDTQTDTQGDTQTERTHRHTHTGRTHRQRGHTDTHTERTHREDTQRGHTERTHAATSSGVVFSRKSGAEDAEGHCNDLEHDEQQHFLSFCRCCVVQLCCAVLCVVPERISGHCHHPCPGSRSGRDRQCSRR